MIHNLDSRKYSGHELFALMTSRKIVEIKINGGTICGMINCIELEDGSGHRFILSIRTEHVYYDALAI